MLGEDSQLSSVQPQLKNSKGARAYPNIVRELEKVSDNRYLLKAVAERPPAYLNGSST